LRPRRPSIDRLALDVYLLSGLLPLNQLSSKIGLIESTEKPVEGTVESFVGRPSKYANLKTLRREKEYTGAFFLEMFPNYIVMTVS